MGLARAGVNQIQIQVVFAGDLQIRGIGIEVIGDRVRVIRNHVRIDGRVSQATQGTLSVPAMLVSRGWRIACQWIDHRRCFLLQFRWNKTRQ